MERHKTSARGDNNLSRVAMWTDIQTQILETLDIPHGILIGLGYNVTIADEGARYTEKEMRFRCHGSVKDFITTMTETQSGTGIPNHCITSLAGTSLSCLEMVELQSSLMPGAAIRAR